MEEDFLTIEEVARKLRMKVYTIRSYVRKGQLPAYRFGREYRIKREDYEKFVQEHRRNTSTTLDE
jgi:excisionase family DNA binding protein